MWIILHIKIKRKRKRETERKEEGQKELNRLCAIYADF